MFLAKVLFGGKNLKSLIWTVKWNQNLALSHFIMPSRPKDLRSPVDPLPSPLSALCLHEGPGCGSLPQWQLKGHVLTEVLWYCSWPRPRRPGTGQRQVCLPQNVEQQPRGTEQRQFCSLTENRDNSSFPTPSLSIFSHTVHMYSTEIWWVDWPVRLDSSFGLC